MKNKKNNLNNAVEQGEVRKNNLNSAIEQGRTGEQGYVNREMTIEQVKAEVLKLVDDGVTYRDIAKIKWNVNGAKRNLSISTLSNWVKERDNPQKLSDEQLPQNAFKLFDAGGGPIAVVEQYGASPEKAKSLYDKYVELKALDLSKPSVPLQLKKLKEELDKGLDGWSLIDSLVEALNRYSKPEDEQVKVDDLIWLFINAKELVQHLKEYE